MTASSSRTCRLLALLLLLSTACIFPPSSAGQAALKAPGEIRTDTTYGHVGDWFAVRSLDDTQRSYSSFAGRTLFINFWATWCAPCVQEMPTIVDLAESMDGADVDFLLISIDEFDRDVRRFAMKEDLLPYVYLRGWSPGASPFRAGIVPATFIVAPDGTIVYEHHGAANWNTDTIRRYLAEVAAL